MLFLGSMTYGHLRLHFLVLYILRDLSLLPVSGFKMFIIVYGITVVLSTAAYLLVEKSTNQYGRRIVKNFQSDFPVICGVSKDSTPQETVLLRALLLKRAK